VVTKLGLVSETNLAAALSRFLSLALARSADVPLERILPDLIEADFLIGANL
jgi:general secretion pathway protein E